MSKFSEKCKQLLSENGSNVYRISKSASLERTALQRMVTGKRLPSQDIVKSFCQALRISFSEEQELMELYKMELIGLSAYKNQKCIFRLFEHLTELEKMNAQASRNVIDNSDLVLVSPVSNLIQNYYYILFLKKYFNRKMIPLFTRIFQVRINYCLIT